ncbi:DNA-binding response regulator [Actinobacteria bacterium YIM 96077]|uniref:DNA-binding response regulator n=1 Tax=Phytoactinopolyspora halophila TaxID=1981511 RepID=A0A329QP61_9ACTN|nr:response regulator transcription factor [Phytoactinopolyspora halophila]AYY15082.1 DNA-binding response regulator [Actinobacteria bacterium YIM 96077]RAW14155.1 DNA-binding response regulator [Phytoactinopolyspora halophila]
MAENAIRVLLVDDEELARAGLRVIIESQGDMTVAGEAADGAQAISMVSTLRPDVVMMDVRMPSIDGIQATHTLMSRADPPRILVVTTFENDDYVYDALRAGAHGFVLKRTPPDQIMHAVRTVFRGDGLLYPDAIRRLAARRRSETSSGDPALLPGSRLTDREGEVLRMMAAGLSNVEIAGELVLGVETVKTHVGNVLTKLGVRDRTQAVIAAYESGFVAPSE